MSIEALVWAFEQQVKPATAKFVLVALSNNANIDGKAWPSLETICRKTCLDRKTVVKCLDWLEELGLLLDTGERRGSTKQVKVYRLNGLDTGERHYVYRVRHLGTGEYYIGVRSTWGAPETDDKYYGSGEWPIEMRRRKEPLVKDILAVFKERRHAERFETEALVAVRDDPRCKNASTGSVPLSELSRYSHETVPLFAPKGAENGTENPKKQQEPKGESAAARRTRLSPDFQISERVKRWYAEKGYPEGLLPAHLEKFVRTAKANASKYADWDEAFMNAIADDWGDIRRNALRALGGAGPAVHWQKSSCRYCDAAAVGVVNQIPYCDPHFDKALGHEPAPQRVTA